MSIEKSKMGRKPGQGRKPKSTQPQSGGVRCTIYLSRQARERLKAEADRNGRSISGHLEFIIMGGK